MTSHTGVAPRDRAGDPEPYYDPYDPVIDRHPYPVWKQLRDTRPIYYNDKLDFFALSRYADVLEASTDWRTYSSARGTVLELMDTTPMGPGEGPGEGLGMMIFMDPPGHDVLRRLASRAFTPRRVSSMEGRLRELCSELLDQEVGGGGFDFVEDFGAKVPAMMIGALLGVPKQDQDQLRVWGDLLLRLEPDGDSPEKLAAITSLSTYMEDLVADRRKSPRDDMVSDLLAAELSLDDGSSRKLEHGEVMSYLFLLQVAGSETTARLLGWAAVLLARHPEQREVLVSQPGTIPNAVEELLRYEPPSPIQARFVTADVEWYGRKVPRGSRIALLTGSAGRDERAFEDPDRFDVRRKIDKHVTFGYGIHFCLGASLARLEGRVVLEETLSRFPEWHVEEDEVELVGTSTVRGPCRVPIRL